MNEKVIVQIAVRFSPIDMYHALLWIDFYITISIRVSIVIPLRVDFDKTYLLQNLWIKRDREHIINIFIK